MKHHTGDVRSSSRKCQGSSIAEFGPALFVLLIVVFLPLIGLCSLAEGAATVYFATARSVREAGAANTFSDADTRMRATANQIIGAFGGFAGLSPMDAGTAGGQNGMQMTVLEVPTSGDHDAIDKGRGGPGSHLVANTNNNFYELQVTSNYTVRPLFWPGQPLPMKFTASCTVEHPEGLGN